MPELIETLFGAARALAIGAFVIVVLLMIVRTARNNYIKVPPYIAAAISGRKHTVVRRDEQGRDVPVTVGYRFVVGGGTLVIPFIERYDTLDLRTITLPDLVVKEAITKEGVKLTVKAVANVKIGSEPGLLLNAAERLMGRPEAEIRKTAYETLEGHLRSMLGTLTVEEVNRDRAALQERMVAESQTDLARLGLKIDVLTVKELSDEDGYLEALGRKKTAEVKRDAEIGAAEAERTAVIQSTTARAEAERKRQENLVVEAEAVKNLNVRKAEYDAQTRAEQARAEQAGPLATAEARREVVAREQEVELIRTQRATQVAEARAAQREQELQTEVIKPAEAQRQAEIVKAEADAQAVRIRANAERERYIAEGTGKAEATRLQALAEAEGVRARLLAEAEGVLKKAEAYKALNESGQLLQILEAAQTLVPNAIREFSKVMAEAAKPIGDVDKIIVMDTGGGNGHGPALSRFADVAPNLVFKFVQQAKEMGIDITSLLKKGGITVSEPVPDGDPAAPAMPKAA